MREMREGESMLARIAAMQDHKAYQEQHWEGSFEDYLKLVRENPKVTRTAFQRIYDMVLSHGLTALQIGFEALQDQRLARLDEIAEVR